MSHEVGLMSTDLVAGSQEFPEPKLGLTVVVPVYRSGAVLRQLHARLVPVLRDLPLPWSRFEVVFVEDGGTDLSWDILRELAAGDRSVRCIRLHRNYGQHNALLCGIRAARGEVIVTMDDDLQNPPEEIPRLLQKLEDGFDVVYGYPHKQQQGLMRNLASRITKASLRRVMGVDEARYASAFRAFRTSLRFAFRDFNSPFVSLDALLAWGTTRFGHVLVRHEPRTEGSSNYNLRKLLRHAVNMVTGYTIWPLQTASLMGFLFTLFGLGVLAYVLGRYLYLGGSVPGFPFLAAIIVIFSGVQLFSLGIMGEYLARIHQRSMNRPAYVEADRTQAIDGLESGGSDGQES